jgi:Tol biopolymer transport system component
MQRLVTVLRSTVHYLWVTALLSLLLAGIVFVPGAAAAQGRDGPQLTVVAQALNVRSGPGVSYPAVGLLVRGDQVPVVGQHAANGWWQVELPDGGRGWVSGGAAYVSVSGDTAGVPEVAASISAAAAQPTTSTTPPSASKAGGTIVFQASSGGTIYAVNADGSNLRPLTTGMDPALSPDGQWVAFTRWVDTQNGAFGSLWVISVDTLTGTPARVAEPGRAGGTGERVVLNDVRQPESPVWSPDGTQIALSMQHGGRLQEERKCSGQRPPREAYDVDVNRQASGDVEFCYTLPPHPYWGLRRVDVASGKFEDLPNDLFSYSPTWDPANAWRLVYDGERGLRSLDLNQGTSWALTDDVDDHSPLFSPDGSKIAVSYWQHDHWEVHVLNADGSGRVRLTETSIRAIVEQQIKGQMPKSWNNAAPAWSPDGSQIAFLTDRDGQWEIWVMNADGTDQHSLLPGEVQAQLSLQYNGMEERVLSWR